MKKVILKIENGYITDIGEYYNTIPNGYDEYSFESYPNNIMCGCYKLIDGAIVLDNDKYAEFVAAQELAEQDIADAQEG